MKTIALLAVIAALMYLVHQVALAALLSTFA